MKILTSYTSCILVCLATLFGCGENAEPNNPESQIGSSTQLFEDGISHLGEPRVAWLFLLTSEDNWNVVCGMANEKFPSPTDSCLVNADSIIKGYSMIEDAANANNLEALRYLIFANNLELDAAVEKYRADNGIVLSTSGSFLVALQGPKRLGGLWERLANNGDIEAKAFMGYLYKAQPTEEQIEEGNWFVDNQDLRKAERLLREAAQSENIFAMNELSELIQSVKPVEAYDWARRAALLGSALAANKVAWAHVRGEGTLKNNVMAAAWAKIAESKGQSAIGDNFKVGIDEVLKTRAHLENGAIEYGGKQEADREFPKDFNAKVEKLTTELFNSIPVGDVDGERPSQLNSWAQKFEALEQQKAE